MKLPLDLETIRHLEELASAAWAPAAAPALGGWRLRHDAGVSRRANSVQALDDPGGDLDEQIARVEREYRAWGLPPRFQLCPASRPPELDEELARRGYLLEARTAVQVASAAVVQELAARRPPGNVVLRSAPDAEWWSVYLPSEGGGAASEAARRAILARVRDSAAYATLGFGPSPAAVGLALARGEWAGLFCIATAPSHRRLGAATAMVASLAEWAGGQGATRLYLQVMESNVAATALYARLGFRTAYHYHYRAYPRDRG